MTAPDAELARRVLRDPVSFVAFGFGSGLAPVAPGTAGSLVGVLFAWATADFDLLVRVVIAILLFVTGIRLCGESARRIGVHDHPGIVWDEIAGMYVTLLVVPPAYVAWTLGFVLFRIFDIVKPWPIREVDHRLGGGLGIMLDDLVAALYAAALLALWGLLMS